MTASVIPYYDELETFGIILHKESEDKIPMKKFDWPKKLGHRQPSGGSDDAICYETISIAWRHNELWVKTPLESTLEAKSLSEKEFSFYGYFYAQLDGDVAYREYDTNRCICHSYNTHTDNG
uniref:Uncharacterized protein n=1 Tax=Acrobeloides nanus TaxID=290746 RepID=A0A914C1N9_9BILA